MNSTPVNLALATQVISEFKGEIYDSHQPRHMWCGCIDGREKGGGNFKFGTDAIRVTEIAASFPPYEDAPRSLRAKFSFRKLKDVSVIKLTGHSDCGGAQTAIAYPRPEDAPDEDVANIVHTLADTGADIPRLKEAFMIACEGNVATAANLLSRHITLVSLDNISRYPHVNDQIRAGLLDAIPLYHVLKNGTGKHSHLERYDVDKQIWVPTTKSVLTNMCERPDGCNSCDDCHSTIQKSLNWVFVKAANQGKIIDVEVPLHVSKLFEQYRDFYQPELDGMLSKSSRGHRIYPFHAVCQSPSQEFPCQSAHTLRPY